MSPPARRPPREYPPSRGVWLQRGRACCLECDDRAEGRQAWDWATAHTDQTGHATLIMSVRCQIADGVVSYYT